MIARLLLIVLLLLPACAWADDAEDAENARKRQDAERVERTKDEARAVLAAILRDDKIELTPCRFDTRWSTRPIGGDIAQAYLGSSIDADVVASHPSVSPADLIDLGGPMGGSFCSDEEAHVLWRQMMDDFRSGAIPGEPDIYEGKPISPPRLRLRRIEFTMPVFDRTFTTAAVVVSFTHDMMLRIDAEQARRNPQTFDEAGYSRRGSIEERGQTYVYRKQDGHWTRIHETEDWWIH